MANPDRVKVIQAAKRFCGLLRARKGMQLNLIFRRTAVSRMERCISSMVKADLLDDDAMFCVVLNNQFLHFLGTAERRGKALKEELNNLQGTMATLKEISDTLSFGAFQSRTVNVIVESQKVISWLRDVETLMLSVKTTP